MTSHPFGQKLHRGPPAWVADLIVSALIATLALAPYAVDELRPVSPFATALLLAPLVVLPWRRRHPLLVLAACILLFGVSVMTGVTAPGIVLATVVAMFGAATRTPRRTTLIAAGVAVGVIAVLSLIAALGDLSDPRVVQFAIFVAFASAAGDATRSRREYIVAVTERAERAEQTREAEASRRVTEERLRIARDLHDAVAHQIAVISLNAGVASSALESRPDAARQALASIRTASRAVLTEIGDLLTVLRSSEDAPAADIAAPQPGLGRLDELLDRFRAAGLEVTHRVEGDVARLPVAGDIVAYRVIQEALTNAHKHGSPPRAHVLVAIDDNAARIVVTNPVSPDRSHATDAIDGNGLTGMRERVATVRGSVETGFVDGGYRVTAELPVTRIEQV